MRARLLESHLSRDSRRTLLTRFSWVAEHFVAQSLYCSSGTRSPKHLYCCVCAAGRMFTEESSLRSRSKRPSTSAWLCAWPWNLQAQRVNFRGYSSQTLQRSGTK